MDISQLIHIDSKTVSIADSFVKYNKLNGSMGHGESRLYIGKKEDINFFNNFNQITCLFLKSKLLEYLDDAKFEYEEQSQSYKSDISSSWLKYKDLVLNLEDQITFNITNANGEKDTRRFYINSTDDIYNLLREIALPQITKLVIMKMKNNENRYFFIFIPFIDVHNGSIDNTDIKKDTNLEHTNEITTDKKALILARRGQGLYRANLIKKLSACVITKVDDDRLLIASHIKPWAKCNDLERLDPFNGLLLTPTYDKLFDLGFITIENIKKTNKARIITSDYMSDNNKKILKIPTECDLVYNSKRNDYLAYHNSSIFRKI